MMTYHAIDKLKINKLKYGNHLTIHGHCVNEDGSIPHIDVKINGESKEYEYIPIPRPDICKKYNLDNFSMQNGFRIILDVTEEIKSIKLFVDQKEINSIG